MEEVGVDISNATIKAIDGVKTGESDKNTTAQW